MRICRSIAVAIGLAMLLCGTAVAVSLQFNGQLTAGAGTCRQVSSSQIACEIPAGSSGTLTLTATVSPPGNPVSITGTGLPPWVSFQPASGVGSVSTGATIAPPASAAGQSASMVFAATTVYGLHVDLYVDLTVTSGGGPPPNGGISEGVPYPGTTDEEGGFVVPLGGPGETVNGTLTECTVFPLPETDFVVFRDAGRFVFRVPGYSDTVVDQFGTFVVPFVNITVHDVGTVCMTPAGKPDLKFLPGFPSLECGPAHPDTCPCMMEPATEACGSTPCPVSVSGRIGNPRDPEANPGEVLVAPPPTAALVVVEGDATTVYPLQLQPLDSDDSLWLQVWTFGATVVHTFSGREPALFRVVIDPENLVAEEDEENNRDEAQCGSAGRLEDAYEIRAESGVLDPPGDPAPNVLWTVGLNRELCVYAEPIAADGDGAADDGAGGYPGTTTEDAQGDARKRIVAAADGEAGGFTTVALLPCPSCVCYEWDFDGDGAIDAQGKRATHTYTANGVYTVLLRVSAPGEEPREDTQDVKVTDRPVIEPLVWGYEDTFIAGISVPNPCTATVLANSNAIERVEFTMNGVTTVRPPSDPVAVYDMGALLPYPATNTLTVIAYGTKPDGSPVSSDPQTDVVPIAPVPGWLVWALNLVSGSPLTAKRGTPPRAVTYETSFEFPSPPIKTSFEIPSYIPLLDGTYEMNAGTTFELAVTSLPGHPITSSFEAGAAFTKGGGDWTFGIEGKVSVSATARIGPPLRLEGGSLSASIEGSASKDFDLTDVFPSLKAAERIPLVGSAVSYLASRAEIGLGLSVGLSGTTEFTSADPGPGSCVEGFDCNGTLSVYGGGRLSLTVDLEVVSATAYGSSQLTATFVAPGDDLGFVDFDSLVLSGSFGVSVTAHLWLVDVTKEYSVPFSCRIASPDEGAAPEETGPWTIAERPYVRPGYDRYDGGVTTDAEFRTRTLLLVADAFPWAAPSLAATADSAFMVWTTDDPSVPFPRGREIAGSIGAGLATMGAPLRLTDNDLPDAQVAIHLATGDTPCAIWVQHADPPLGALTLDDLTPELMAPLEIVYAVFDRAASRWGDPLRLTNNGIAEHTPALVPGIDGVAGAVWVGNEAGEILAGPRADTPDILYYAPWTGSGFGSVEPLRAPAPGVERSFAALPSGLLIAWVEDGDGDWETAGDAEILVSHRNAEGWGPTEPLTANSVDDDRPTLVPLAEGRAALLWRREAPDDADEATGALMARVYDGQAWADEVELIVAPHLITYTLASAGERVAVVWEGFSASGPDLYAVECDPAAGSCSDPRQLTDDAAAEGQLAAAFDGARLLVAFVRTEFGEEIDSVTVNGERVELNVLAPQSTNLVLLEAEMP